MQRELLPYLVALALMLSTGCTDQESQTTQAPAGPGATQTPPAPTGAGPARPDMPELAQQNGCTVCHARDKRIIGPAWSEVSQKYQNDPNARAQLIEKVKKGGSGVWGQVAMPPNSPRVSDENIEKLVDYVLSLAKS